MRLVLLFITIIGLCYYSTVVGANFTTPNPWNPFNNYGFEIGKKYTKQFITNDPFDNKPQSVDTVTVKAFAKDYVQFTNGDTKRFGSIGMGFYQWKAIK